MIGGDENCKKWNIRGPCKYDNNYRGVNIGVYCFWQKSYLNDNEPFFDLAISSAGTGPDSWFRSKFLHQKVEWFFFFFSPTYFSNDENCSIILHIKSNLQDSQVL